MMTNRTRIKICGITNERDLDAAVALGADALGFNMYPGSSRHIGLEDVAMLTRRVPPFVAKVGVFVDQPEADVQRACDIADFDWLQFHGNETDEFCKRFDWPFMKAIGVDEATDVGAVVSTYPSAGAILLDAKVDGRSGGTGRCFDWSQIPALETPLILAGGLSADNVGMAIAAVRPYTVDVSSGVESSPGKKDIEKMRAFVAAVALADSAGSANKVPA